MTGMKTSTAALVIALALGAAGAAEAAPLERAYIGSFTNNDNSKSSTPFSSNHGEGIYVVDLDPATGKLTPPRLVAKTPTPSWIVIDQAHDILYSGNEYGGFADAKTGPDAHGGSVSAFRIDRAGGGLTLINQASASGAPAAIAIDPSGKYVLAANYTGGSLAVLPIRADGGLGDYTDLVRPTGPEGPVHAEGGPRGNMAPSSHAGSHMHYVGFDPSGRYAVADDAGLDKVMVFTLDTATGKLAPVSTLAELPGSAPRHFGFSPDGRTFYNLMEQESKLVVCGFDPATGKITPRQRLSTLPPEFAGSNLASEILVAADGRHIYTANRLRDTITTFAVAANGTVRRVTEVHTENSYPRSLAIDPSGRYLFSLNQYGDSVTSFRLDARTGVPHYLQASIALGNPATMAFLRRR